jgi:transposase
MNESLHRHDVSDTVWEKIAPHLPGKPGGWGGVAKDNRLFVNAVLWVARAGAPWRDLPPSYGGWSNTHRRFTRWRDKGVWERLLAEVVDDPDFEWLMIGPTHPEAHSHAAGAAGGSEGMGRTKGGSTQKPIWPWMLPVCRCACLSRRAPVRIARMLRSSCPASPPGTSSRTRATTPTRE